MGKLAGTLVAGSIFVVGTAFAVQPPDVVASDGANNTAMGTDALKSLTDGTDNTASGEQALGDNTSGFFNTALGSFALSTNTTGPDNTAVGFIALSLNQTGYSNTGLGAFSLYNNVSGNENVAVGVESLYHSYSGSQNTAVGNGSLQSNDFGEQNTASGYQTLYYNVSGNHNTADGSEALFSNIDGASNTASGYHALYANDHGYHNSTFGTDSMSATTSGASNSALGFSALGANTSGSNNIALGAYAGSLFATGSNNIHIGSKGLAGDNAHIRIGTQGTQSATYIAGISGTHVTGAAVYVTSSGQLGVLASSERYKTAIAPMDSRTEKLQQLRPVTFHLKSEPKGEVQYGLIAEEVARVYPELVIRDDSGRVEGVRYDELAPMLLNELQKEHAHLLEAQTLIESQNGRLDALQEQVAELGSRMAEAGSAGTAR